MDPHSPLLPVSGFAQESAGKFTEKDSEDSIRSILDSLPMLVCQFLPDGCLTYVNREYCQYFGKKSQDLLGKNFLDLVPETAHATIRAHLGRLSPKMPRIRYEHEVLLTSGAIAWQRWTDSAFFDAQGEPVVYQSVGEDITEQKAGEEELRQLAMAMAHAGDCICIADDQERILYVNPAFEAALGFRREEMVGGLVRAFVMEMDMEAMGEIRRIIRSGKTWKGMVRSRRKEDAPIEMEAIISPVTDGEGKILNYVAVQRDVTTQRLLERQLQQSQKMEAVGKLAGGVAHDFNNLLFVIMGALEMARVKLGDLSAAERYLSDAMDSVQRAGDLTKQLLAFSRSQVLAPRLLDLNGVMEGLERMLTRVIGEHIRLSFVPAEKMVTIRADATQLQQVVLNLVVNARDAMTEGGSLVIRTDTRQLEAKDRYRFTDAKAFSPGCYAMLRVEDSGVGMTDAIRPHIFEPFFTTKKEMGTGLGLAVVYGIVRQHGGFLAVESSPGKGTCVTVYFPEAHGLTPEAEREVAESRSPLPRGTETLLVVEDDPAVRRMLEKSLTSLGYRVLTAVSGKEAEMRLREHEKEIALLLTDMILPDTNGKELWEKVMVGAPHLPVLFMSGYLGDRLADFEMDHLKGLFLQKPVPMATLARNVREALDRAALPEG